jgi:hypothetical protein
MEVNIDEMSSTIRAVDGNSLLDARTLRSIVNAVLRAVEEKDSHAQRVRAEQRISAGVRAELEEEH